MNTPDLQGKNIIITGGSTGLGYASARVALSGGANVVVCARDASRIASAVQRLEDEGFTGRIRGVVADVADLEAVETAMSKVEEYFGSLNGVIHAAAVLPPIGPIDVVSPTEWWQTMHINLLGSFNVVRSSCAQMKRSNGGRIVAYSGGGAASPLPNYTAYGCSKAAMVRFIECAAIEMAPFGIELNALAPGFVATEMHNATLEAGLLAGEAYLEKTRRNLASEAVSPLIAASAAAFLVSDAAIGISGKLVAALHDDYKSWADRLKDPANDDLFTLRRIVPRDRGMDWQ